MLPPNEIDRHPTAAATGAVYAYTMPGLRAGDPPILVTFRRPPADVVADMARFLSAKRKADALRHPPFAPVDDLAA